MTLLYSYFMCRFSYLRAIYVPLLKISIVTARNAPSHKRVINTMRGWGISVNEAFLWEE
ncbi:5'-nucleotidase [Proteus penneri]|nr:5'-nucleotidase [Proteus penneri]